MIAKKNIIRKSENRVVIETRLWEGDKEFIYNFITWYYKGSYLIPYFDSEKNNNKRVKIGLL